MPACYWAVISHIPPSIFHITKLSDKLMKPYACKERRISTGALENLIMHLSFTYSSVLFLCKYLRRVLPARNHAAVLRHRLLQLPTVGPVESLWSMKETEATADGSDSFYFLIFSDRCSVCERGTNTLILWSGCVSAMQIPVHLSTCSSLSSLGAYPLTPQTAHLLVQYIFIRMHL